MKLSEIRTEIEGILDRNRPYEALEFAQKLERSMSQTDIQSSAPEAYQEITQLIFALYVFAVPIASEEVVERVLRLNVLEALQLDFDYGRHLFERLNLRYNMYTEEGKQEHLSQLIPYLKQNEQNLGDEPLPIADEQRPPLVKNWLDYYDQEAGLEGHSAFDRADFISSDPLAQSLPKHERHLLRSLCKLYDFLQGEVEEQHIYEVSEAHEPSPADAEPSDVPSAEEAPDETDSLADQMTDTGTVDLQNMPSPQEKSAKGTVDLRELTKNKASDTER